MLAAGALSAAVLFGLPTAAQAAPPNIYKHCTAPIVGYLIVDVKAPYRWHGAKLVLVKDWNITADEQVQRGGDLMVVKCIPVER
jgi:hypothetical protein